MFLGIDCGTQGTKALLLDASNGRVLGQGSASHDLISGPNGRREQDTEQWTAAFASATAAALAEAGVDGDAVLGIGVSGQQHGLVTLDAAGRVLRPAKLWCDTESAAENQRLLDWLGGEQGSLQRLGIVIAPGYTVSKLLWMKEQHPALFARIAHVLLPHDYLNYWLTGRCASEYGDASGTGYFDVHTRQWAPDILRHIDADGRLEAALPELIESHQPVGRIRPELAARLGLSPHAMVASGGGDNMMGGHRHRQYPPRRHHHEPGHLRHALRLFRRTPYQPATGSGHLLLIQRGWLPLICTMNLTNANAAMRDLLELDLEAFNALVAQAPIGCEGVTMLPFLNGERVPGLPQASASLHGLTADNLSRANLCRAVLEGVTFGLRYGLDLLRESGIRSERIQLIGGGAKNPLWRQIVADMMATPVVCTHHGEAAALGGAIQAAWCHARQQDAGASLEAICSRCVSLDERTAVAPVAESVRAYEQAYRRYRQLVASTYGQQTPPELTPIAS